jgi:hypothetical protein
MIYSTLVNNKIGDFELTNHSSYEIDIQISYKHRVLVAIRDDMTDIHELYRWMYSGEYSNILPIELETSIDIRYFNYSVCKIVGIDEI